MSQQIASRPSEPFRLAKTNTDSSKSFERSDSDETDVSDKDRANAERELLHWAIAGWAITGLYAGPLVIWLIGWLCGDVDPLWVLSGIAFGPITLGCFAWVYGKSNAWVMFTGIRLVVWHLIIVMLLGVFSSIAKIVIRLFE